MIRRGLAVLIALTALLAWLSPVGPGVHRATAFPVATSDATYGAFGRVFPDPQGCTKGTPGSSPWAKGNVCATTFIGWEEALTGLRFLQAKFPRFAQVVNLHDLKATVPEFANVDMQTAGLPQADLSRDRKDMYAFVVTDRESNVAVADRERYAFSLSIHGIERAGLEGGIRAAEDLITWAATAPNTRILEPTDSGPTAGDVLKNNVLYFFLSNPDGWSRGDLAQGGVFFQRYNGNGVDLNREFPGIGYSNPVYTPNAEPETKSWVAYLRRERALGKNKPFAGSVDLHGMNAAPSFSYTLMPGGTRDYATNAKVVQTAQAIYHDAAKRLSWSPLIADPASCPGPVPVFIVVASGSLPMCPDQWGNTWDTINYQTTGSLGDWMGMSSGLGAVGFSNEMAFSHLFPNTTFIPALEQLHVDGNKGLIYAQIASLTNPAPPPPLNVAAAYAPAARRLVRTATTPAAIATLPAQAPFTAQEVLGQGVEFDVQGPAQGVHNGGLTAQFTFANLTGVSLDSLSDVTLERFGSDHAGDPEEWHEVAHWYRQEATYLPAGARIDVNNPLPGRYRLRQSGTLRTLIDMRVSFSPAQAVPIPNVPYDVANTDVFKGLGTTKPITAAAVLANPKVLDGIATYVLADDPAPGVAAADRPRWFGVLKAFVERGGNLVLTDNALDALEPLGVVPASALTKGAHYAGWISFTDDKAAPTMEKLPLTTGLDLPGASEGSGDGLELRRQTYDPAAVGFQVGESGGGSCSDGRCESPQVIVDPAAWTAAGGVIAGRTAILLPQPDEEPTGPLTVSFGEPAPTKIGVVYGEAPLGKGHVRIAGALLPTPTEKNNHPYGLEAHGLSWTGYQVLVNLLTGGAPGSVLEVTTIPATGGQSRVPLDVAAAAIGLAALVRFARARRRLHAVSRTG